MDYSNKWPYWKDLSKRVKELANYTCEDCGKTRIRLYAHHIVPISKGGRNTLDNLKAICYTCHLKYHVHLQEREKEKTKHKNSKSKILFENYYSF